MTFVYPDSGIVRAPAKINLHLKVCGVLPDGRHLLDTSFAFVDVYDELEIHLASQLDVRCSDARLSGERNLVYQVLKALQQASGVQQGLSVFIQKNLPSEAGLGGGSSDAAVALLAANVLWGLHWDLSRLIALATPLGADIPCFLFGRASLASGVGEQLQELSQDLPEAWMCLVRPKTGLSTEAVFHHYDEQHENMLTGKQAAATVRPASQGCFQIGDNDLEGSAVSLLDDVACLLRSMRQDGRHSWMSGSGSTCVCLCSSQEEANTLLDLLHQEGLVYWAHVGHVLRMHPAFSSIGA